MDKNQPLAFENKNVRITWFKDDWYFSIVDVIGALTDSVNPTDYLKKLRKRDEELATYLGTNCPQVEMLTLTNKKRLTLAGNTKDVFRIIQSIPSKKAEPFKLWLAQVGKERIDEIQDPELTIDRAMKVYLQKGYSKEWINQRLKTIEVRKELTNEWESRGVIKPNEFAILTNVLTKAWSGKTVKSYKEFKNLKKENLRDHMTNIELILNMLAEASTTELSKKTKPETFEENEETAKEGGSIAGQARKTLELKTKEKIISKTNNLNIKTKKIKKLNSKT